jgi:hypothetical protein
MKTFSKIICLALFTIVSGFSQISFSPSSGSQTIDGLGGNFQLQITPGFSPPNNTIYMNGFSMGFYSFPTTVGGGYGVQTPSSQNPYVYIAPNNTCSNRTLTFVVNYGYLQATNTVYTIYQLGYPNGIIIPTPYNNTITGNMSPCKGSTITYTLPLITTGIHYNIKFSTTVYFYKATTTGGNFDITFNGDYSTTNGQYGISINKVSNCDYTQNSYYYGKVYSNPITPTISGMNVFTIGSPINFSVNSLSGENYVWYIQSITASGDNFAPIITTPGNYLANVESFKAYCNSPMVSFPFTILGLPLNEINTLVGINTNTGVNNTVGVNSLTGTNTLTGVDTTTGVNTLTGISDFIHSDIKIYPNPTNGIVNIQTNKPFIKIEIYRIDGVKMYELSFQKEISLNNLLKGTYIFILSNSSGIKVKSDIIIKE